MSFGFTNSFSLPKACSCRTPITARESQRGFADLTLPYEGNRGTGSQTLANQVFETSFYHLHLCIFNPKYYIYIAPLSLGISGSRPL